MYIASPLCIGCLQECMPLLSIWLSLVHSVISASEELSSSHGDPPSMVRTVWHIALKITVSGVSKNISQWRNISTPCLMVSMMTFEYWEAVSSSSDQRNVVLGLGILKVLTCPLVAHSWPLVRRCQTTLWCQLCWMDEENTVWLGDIWAGGLHNSQWMCIHWSWPPQQQTAN